MKINKKTLNLKTRRSGGKPRPTTPLKGRRSVGFLRSDVVRNIDFEIVYKVRFFNYMSSKGEVF